MVSRINAPSGVRALRDNNGRVEIELNAAGPIALRSPAMFGPGQNRVSASAGEGAATPLVSFSDQGQNFRELPLSASVAVGQTNITIREWTAGQIKLQTDGAANLTIGDVTNGARYRVIINGQTSEKVGADKRLKLDIAGASTIEIKRINRL